MEFRVSISAQLISRGLFINAGRRKSAKKSKAYPLAHVLAHSDFGVAQIKDAHVGYQDQGAQDAHVVQQLAQKRDAERTLGHIACQVLLEVDDRQQVCDLCFKANGE